MVENAVRLGLVADIGDDETSAWLKVGELGLVEKYINNPLSGKPTFGEFCAAYVKDGLPFRRFDGAFRLAATVLLATGVRISECLGLTWKHVEWANNRIFIHQTFRRGEMQNRTKTKASNAPVPMCAA